MSHLILRRLIQIAPRTQVAALAARAPCLQAARSIHATPARFDVGDGGGMDFRTRSTSTVTAAPARARGGRRVARGSAIARTRSAAPPPPAAAAGDPWVSVKDDASGQIYWWNQETNETTALGQPKPTAGGAVAPADQQQQGGGLMQTVKEGFAFGVGSSVARMAVGSLFGGGGDEGGGDMSGGDAPASGTNEWGDEDEL